MRMERPVRTIVATVATLVLTAGDAATALAQGSATPSGLTARVSRWQGDPVKKRKGPEGFDIQFRLVGSRFDGTFGVEGVPQSVPEGEALEVQLKLTNIGNQAIRLAGVTVTGDGTSVAAELGAKRVEPKSAATVATFKIPAQSSAGSSYVITVVQVNGDKHTATLTFGKAS
jgi:hypothetical protein